MNRYNKACVLILKLKWIMIYTKLIKKAMLTAFAAHKEQTDKSGLPYIFHPIHLAEQMETEEEIVVALLHDVVEDTGMTLEDLVNDGFPESVITALSLMTHAGGVEYMDYIRQIKSNQIATKVKLTDLRHNSDVTRLEIVDDKALQRIEKYIKAIDLLST
jgi:(p)ppGpp synthase/HD superfamily hydrolase